MKKWEDYYNEKLSEEQKEKFKEHFLSSAFPNFTRATIITKLRIKINMKNQILSEIECN